MPTLIYIEHHVDDNGVPTITDACLTTIEAGKLLDQPIHALIVGTDVKQLAEQVATVSGVVKVLYVDDKELHYPLPERIAPIMVELDRRENYRYLIAPASGVGKNIMPRVAGLLDFMQVSEVTRIVDAQTFEHFIYAGSVIETVQSQQEKDVLTIRTTSFSQCNETQDHAEVICLPSDDFVDTLNDAKSLSNCTRVDNHVDGGLLDISNASVVVAGGGGLAREEDFHGLLGPLADALGGAIGASRFPIFNGFCPSDSLIGQTGKAIAPTIYIAVGISGATQHMAGVGEAKTIIAINSDENAPIFNHADYGLVADAQVAVPELTKFLTAK